METLTFQKYYHGESIAVNVLVDNNTNKTVKRVKISGGNSWRVQVGTDEGFRWELMKGSGGN